MKKIDLVEKLYNEGERDKKVIAEKIGNSTGTVNTYINRLIEKGKIQPEMKEDPSYIEYKRLYKEGIRKASILAEMLGVTERRIYYYSKKLKDESIEEPEKSIYSQTIALYNKGVQSTNAIAKTLNANKKTIQGYIYKARRKGLLIDSQFSNKNDNSQKHPAKTDIKKVIKNMLSKKYPLEIAEELGIKPVEVFDVWDSMTDEEQKNATKEFIKSKKTAFNRLNNLRESKNLSVEEAIKIMEMQFLHRRPKELFNVADICYALGYEVGWQRQMNIMIRESDIYRNKAIAKKDQLSIETKAIQIRREIKQAQSIGKEISYDDLCRKYCVRTRFLIDIAGMESRHVGIPSL